jgi:predicted DNA-binding transcriptional regulator YafY
MPRASYPRLHTLAQSLFKSSIPRTPPTTLAFQGDPASAAVEDPEERATAAVGALLVWQIIQHGGSSLPVGPAARAAERLVQSFPETDRHRLEKESVEILHWLEDALNLLGDEWEGLDSRVYPWEDQRFPEEGTLGLIREALGQNADLEIEYFTYRRNAMSRRRITPLRLDDEGKLRAVCHWRSAERTFAVSRIKEARLIRTRSSGSRSERSTPDHS